jgi:hypothetical protein
LAPRELRSGSVVSHAIEYEQEKVTRAGEDVQVIAPVSKTSRTVAAIKEDVKFHYKGYCHQDAEAFGRRFRRRTSRAEVSESVGRLETVLNVTETSENTRFGL